MELKRFLWEFLKTNEATVKIMLKNGGKIIGDFKGEKQIILIPLQ